MAMSGVVGERYHALDAVRGGVLVLGVFFHATLSFLPGDQMWLVMDASRSTELSVLFFTLHIFRMTVFFVLAGFFGRLLLERLGVGAFVMNRVKRIATPLVMFLAAGAHGVHCDFDLGCGASQWRHGA
ncbi:MAG: acyltransferase family protein [Caulobacteraceae bacterium]|nr:acyltransferase family protein [Caulobacteraceae bacterium]